MSSRFIIYGLIDPRNGQLRYVGQSSRGLIRPKQRHARHCWSWEENLKCEGLVPEIEILQECNLIDELDEAEIFWIGYFRMIGANLTNISTGGCGSKGAKRSEEWKDNLSKKTIFRNPINLGRVHPDEEKLRRANSNKHKRGKYKVKTQEAQKELSQRLSILRKGKKKKEYKRQIKQNVTQRGSDVV